MESEDILHPDFLRSTASLEGKPLLHRSKHSQRSGMEREQILHAERQRGTGMEPEQILQRNR